MSARTGAFGLAVVAVALLACKSKHDVTGAISVNGSPFVVEQCTLAEVRAEVFGATSVTRSVTLVDGAGRRLSFSDANGGAVSFSAGGSGFPADAGRGCGTVRFVGAHSDPASVVVHVDMSCRASGVETVAKAQIQRCGTFGPTLAP